MADADSATAVPSAVELKALARGDGPAPSGADLKALAGPVDEWSVTDFGSQFLAGINDILRINTIAEERRAAEIAGRAFTPAEARRRLGIPLTEADLAAQGPAVMAGMATASPETLAGSAGRMAGLTAATAPLLGAAGAAIPLAPVPAGAGMATKAGLFLRNLFPQAGRSLMARPVRGLAMETVAGATAGAGGYVAVQAYPDSSAAKLAGEVVGGLAPSLLPMRIALNTAAAARRYIGHRLHGGRRAGERARRAVPESEREAVAARLDDPTTLDPDTGLPVLTPSQRTGEPGLLALERAVMESSDELAREADDQIWRANQVIQQSAETIGTAPESVAEETIEAAHQYLGSLLETRVRIATQQVDERVAALGPRATREQVNRIAAEEIESALAAARRQENELYAAIPQGAAVPTSAATSTYKNLLDGLSLAQMDDMPQVARRLLDPESKEFLGAETTIKELRGLQSKLRAVARNARAGDTPNYDQARLADGIADSITDDIARTLDDTVSGAVALAVGFSRGLNDRFSRGVVGKLLGRDVRGSRRVPEGLTLEQTLGGGGPKAREAFDGLRRAFDSPEAPGSEVMLRAADDYLRGRFMSQAVENGVLNVARAKRFVQDNVELLGRMPEFRAAVLEAIEAGDTAALAASRQARARFSNPSVAKAALYVERGPGEAFRQLARLRPAQAGRQAQTLLNTVRLDTTGEAFEGLKAAFREFLLGTARTGSRDMRGRPFLSGFGLRDTLNKPAIEAMAGKLLSTDERRRLNIIVEDLIKLERRLATDVPQEGIVGDKPAQVIRLVAGLAGAASGRHLARALGFGGTLQAPELMSRRFRQLADAGVHDPVMRLIVDAIRDERLFRELLLAPLQETGQGLTAVARRRLNAWAAVVLAEYGGVIDTGD